jgi:hypothetical protein
VLTLRRGCREEVLHMPWFGGFGPGWGVPFPYRFSPWAYRPPSGWPYTSAPPWGAYAPFWGMLTPETELAALRAQAQWLKGQLEAVEGRISELEAAS